jgi:hypothetical protein
MTWFEPAYVLGAALVLTLGTCALDDSAATATDKAPEVTLAQQRAQVCAGARNALRLTNPDLSPAVRCATAARLLVSGSPLPSCSYSCPCERYDAVVMQMEALCVAALEEDR